jgi:Fe-S-cluster containining protein
MDFKDLDNEINNLPDHDAQDTFPQHLCKMCGRCCKSITTEYTHEELEKLTEEGDEEACVFTKFFKSFPDVDAARKIVPEQIEQIINHLKARDKYNPDNITFYYCPYITENNLCSIHEGRPECCRRAPRNGWSLMPPGCGFEGWQFEQREKHKKTIRALKEYLYELEKLSHDGKVPGKDITVEELKKLIQDKIKPWERYGAFYW